MKDIFFPPSENSLTCIPSTFDPAYFSGGGGLMTTAEEYAKFGEMLLEGGKLNANRLLSPTTVELMASVFVPDTMPGRSPGKGFGLSVQVITDSIPADQRVSKGSFG
jgi:CubicO group peptidase (beta-lactamase class C family)